MKTRKIRTKRQIVCLIPETETIIIIQIVVFKNVSSAPIASYVSVIKVDKVLSINCQ